LSITENVRFALSKAEKDVVIICCRGQGKAWYDEIGNNINPTAHEKHQKLSKSKRR